MTKRLERSEMRRKLSRRLVPALALVAMVAAAAQAVAQDKVAQAEQFLTEALAKHVAPAKSYTVSIDRNGTNIDAGQVSRVEGSGVDIQVGGLVIPKVDVVLEGVKFDLPNKKLLGISKGTFTLTVDDQSLTEYLRQNDSGDFKIRKVDFQGGKAIVRANRKGQGGQGNEFTGTPVIRAGGKRIAFDIEKGTSGGINLPAAALREIEKSVNPLVDFAKLNFPVQLTSLDIKGGNLIATASGSYTGQ